MTQNRRIVLNIVATYGRGLVCAGDRVVLRVGDGDGIGGLTAVEMVKYTVKA